MLSRRPVHTLRRGTVWCGNAAVRSPSYAARYFLLTPRIQISYIYGAPFDPNLVSNAGANHP